MRLRARNRGAASGGGGGGGKFLPLLSFLCCLQVPTLLLEAPLHALVRSLLPLIKDEVGEQAGRRLPDRRRRPPGGSQAPGGGGGGGEEAADDEDWCAQRTFTLALYELATRGSVPVRRDATDLRVWDALLAEVGPFVSLSLLRCSPSSMTGPAFWPAFRPAFWPGAWLELWP